MNTYLLQLITKWISVLFVTVAGIFVGAEKNEVENINQTKNAVVQMIELPYETLENYNDQIPKGKTNIKQEGKNGIAYLNPDDTLETVQEPVSKIIEIGTGEGTQYVGKMTGYGANCKGCSGILSCKTKTGQKWNLAQNGEVYKDDEYGEVRIMAAALTKFPCGTIIEVENGNLGVFTTIILDTGSAMRTAYENGIIHMDLAFISENDKNIFKATSSNVKYNVQRWGW